MSEVKANPILREYPTVEVDDQTFTLAPIVTDRIFDLAELFNAVISRGSKLAQDAIANAAKMGVRTAFDDRTQIVALLTLGASSARAEFKQFFAGLLGLSVEEYEALPFDVTVEALMVLPDHPDVNRFLAIFEQLDVKEMLEVITPEQVTDSPEATTD